MTDPIADMLTRIRNAVMAKKSTVVVPHSKTKEAIAKVLKEQSYIEDYSVSEPNPFKNIEITLKYVGKFSAITKIDRVSKPGRRSYVRAKYLKPVLSGHGMAIISTSQGLMTDKQAKAAGVGGEILCNIY